MDAILAPRGCINPCYCKGSHVEDELEPCRPLRTISSTARASHAGPAAFSGCKMLNGMVWWLFHGLGDAFFTSLQRFSCINIETKDDATHDSDNSLMAAAHDRNQLSKDSISFEVEISEETA